MERVTVARDNGVGAYIELCTQLGLHFLLLNLECDCEPGSTPLLPRNTPFQSLPPAALHALPSSLHLAFSLVVPPLHPSLLFTPCFSF